MRFRHVATDVIRDAIRARQMGVLILLGLVVSLNAAAQDRLLSTPPARHMRPAAHADAAPPALTEPHGDFGRAGPGAQDYKGPLTADPRDPQTIERLIAWRLSLEPTRRDDKGGDLPFRWDSARQHYVTLAYDQGSVRNISRQQERFGSSDWVWVTADFTYNHGDVAGRIAIAYLDGAPVCVGFRPDADACATLDGQRTLDRRLTDPARQGLNRGVVNSATCPWKDVSGRCD